MDPLQVPLAALCRHGVQEFSLRPFSAGRFIGIVTTRTVAESVFCSQLLKSMRDSGIDELVTKLKVLQPAKVEGSAVRRLQQVEQELREARRQLSEAGKGETPAPESTPTPSSNRRPPSEQLGSTPKKKARKQPATSRATPGNLKDLWAPKPDSTSADPIEPFSDDIPEKGADDEVINAEECLRPRSPVLQDHVPTGHSDPTITKWVKSFPAETREAAVKLIQVIRDAAVWS
eukprot:s90_g27.t1